MTATNKQIFVVLGAARSGTSVIARALVALGVDFGKHLLPPKAEWNAKGFFEDKEIVYRVNRNIFSVLEENWLGWQMGQLSPQKNRLLAQLQQFAKKLIQERMQHTAAWGFKDPRTAVTMPFWQPLFDELQLDDRYVIALRHPLANIASYQKVSGCDATEALFLWLCHTMKALHHTKDK